MPWRLPSAEEAFHEIIPEEVKGVIERMGARPAAGGDGLFDIDEYHRRHGLLRHGRESTARLSENIPFIGRGRHTGCDGDSGQDDRTSRQTAPRPVSDHCRPPSVSVPNPGVLSGTAASPLLPGRFAYSAIMNLRARGYPYALGVPTGRERDRPR